MQTAVTEDVLPFIYRKEYPLRFGVLPKDSMDPGEIRWFVVEGSYGRVMFHIANAWEEPTPVDDLGEEGVESHTKGTRNKKAEGVDIVLVAACFDDEVCFIVENV